MALNDVRKISGRLIYLEGNVPAQAAYIESVEAETLPPGSEAYARNDGSSQNVDLVFGIPQGEQGERGYTGNGIASITLIQTVGLVKVYRILLTDGEHFDFPVADGNGISGIAKASTDVLEDTYRISYTDGTTSTYKVKNGRGIVSVTKTGTSGLVDTYTISYNDGTSSTFTVTNGEKGDTGNGIASISKTGTSGLVDTYTITYTNGQTATFTVTNGNGITKIQKTGTSGLTDTYTITFQNGTTTTYQVVNGNGISSITKTGTSGLVDTYTIAYTNGTSTTFTVTNGEKGDTGNGIQSIAKTATVGLVDTYTITFTDGTTTTFDVTNGSDMWGNITGTLSDQTDLQNALNNKAPAITETASGSIASFTDGSTLPVTALTVGIEPVQDLHGYDNPWPAGGGKNLLPNVLEKDNEATVSKGVTFTKRPDGTILVNGTATGGQAELYLGLFQIEAGKYASLISNTAVNVSLQLRKNGAGGAEIMPSITTTHQEVTISEVTTVYSRLRVPEGLSVNNAIVYPMFAKQDTALTVADFEPYDNICPISGHTSAVVTRTGKNLIGISDYTYTSASAKSWDDITPIKSGSYKFSFSTSNTSGFTVRFLDANGSYLYNQTKTNQSGRVSFNISFSGLATKIYIYSNTAITISDVQLELGSTVTAYEAPQIQTVTIDLDGTRYGGTLDLLTGEMTVDRVLTHYTGQESSWTALSTSGVFQYTNGIAYRISQTPITDKFTGYSPRGSASLPLGGIAISTNYTVLIINTGSTNLEAFQQYMESIGGFDIVRKLASPETVQLTPSQMQTLLGENHIFADTGDV